VLLEGCWTSTTAPPEAPPQQPTTHKAHQAEARIVPWTPEWLAAHLATVPQRLFGDTRHAILATRMPIAFFDGIAGTYDFLCDERATDLLDQVATTLQEKRGPVVCEHQDGARNVIECREEASQLGIVFNQRWDEHWEVHAVQVGELSTPPVAGPTVTRTLRCP
jgi:hypothetical protein